MVNAILDAVTTQLGVTFGSTYHYYVEDVEQKLKTPCFTTNVLLPLQRSKSPVLYDRTMPVVIHYFGSTTKDIKKDCYEIGEQIVECLEYLPFMGGLIRGEDISWQIVDDVLQVFITYRFTTKKVTPEQDAMDSILDNVSHTN
jgi:hypothetical protein